MKIAIDLGGTNISAALVSKKGEILAIHSEPSETDKTMEHTLQQIVQVIKRFDQSELRGIGISVPSVVDAANGIVYNVTNIPAWKEVKLKAYLEDIFKVTVQVNNDANCFVLGVKGYGEGAPYNDVVGVTLGTGVGIGVIADGKLYNGANTGVGELGCMDYLDATLEDYCGSHFFSMLHTTGAEMYQQAMDGDATALANWAAFGKHLGALVKILLYAYDPEAIVFGGGISKASDLFFPHLQKELETFPYPQTVKRLHLLTSELEHISLLGASELVANH
ncbi:MAG: ROK family protein [Bacteroidaceae bacterium]